MYNEHTVGVVVPAYNEEAFVGTVLETIPEYVDRVYVIDDGSTDGTWNEIRRVADRLNDEQRLQRVPGSATAADGGQMDGRRVIPIQHEENRGVGGAIKTGYKHALEDEIDVTAVMGGDGQMDPELLPRFLDPIVEGEVDYTKGNRLLYSEYRQGMPQFRFFGNAILTFLTKIASGYWKMMDPQNGYTAISRHALENVGIDDLYEYYGYCNDLLVKLNAKGMRIADVAMPAEYGDEVSYIKYHTYIRRVSSMLLQNFLWRLKVRYFVMDFHPLGLFYIFGAISSALGTAGVTWSVYSWKRLENPLFVRLSLSILLFITGSMFLMFAMLFDMQANEDREVQIHD